MIKPLVSIIIANWNGGKVFKNCLDSLVKINYPNWELIVVDNGSTDRSNKLAQKLKLPAKTLLIQNKTNLGFVKANNQGYKESRGKYILLLNNDTKVDPSFLNILVSKAIEDSTIGVLQPKMFLMDKKGYLDNAGSFLTRIGFWHHWGFLEKDSKEFDKEREIFSAKGACMLIKRSVIEKAGLFDNDFVQYFEETDFCWRVWLSGFRVLFYPKAVIYHKVGFTIRRQNVLDINFHYYKNRVASQLKNFSLINIILILMPHLIISIGVAFLFLIRGKVNNSLMIISAIWWNTTNLLGTLKKRSFIQKNRVVSDDFLINKLSVPVNWSRFINDFKRVEEDIERK